MRVSFGSGFDGGVWPAVVSTSYDEAAVGRRGLLRILETCLGLGSAAADITNAERSASLLPSLHARAGAWTRSLDTDPLAVARSVLRLRDALVEAGLDSRADLAGLPPRLREIVEVTASVPPGVPDRLRAVAAALEGGARTDLSRLDVFDALDVVSHAASPSALSSTWRRVLAALARSGVQVVAGAVAEVPASGDLAGARRAPFAPQGDGSLLLLRTDCPEEAAIEVAAHLAAMLSLSSSSLVIGGDAVLDGGLSRMGMPTLGARGGIGEDGLLQVAPLVIALAWPERDPERAFELLTLSCSPLRRAVSARLARALTKEPAVDSDAWRSALALALEALPEAERARAEQRVTALFACVASDGATAGHQSMPLALLEERLALVRSWLIGRMQREADPTKLRGALAQIAAIARIAHALGAPALSRVELMRVVQQASSAARPLQPRPALAGIARVADASAITGPIGHVVWWGFSSSAESLPYFPALTAAERAALASCGVALTDPAAAAELRAAAFARPLLCASHSLVLVCPRRDDQGKDAHPHPLWDEVVARAGGESAARKLEVRELPSTRTLPKKHFRERKVAAPVRDWTFPAGAVKRPARESPSSREALLGCSARAVFERVGLKSSSRALPQGGQLLGELAHDVIGGVLAELRLRTMTPAEAAHLARAVFDQRLPRRAAALARPDEATTRARARELCARAAERLVDLLNERGLSVVAVEQEIVRGPEGRQMAGRPDVVVGDTTTATPNNMVVLDLKSGGDRYRRRSLTQGLALQLVAYAGMLSPESPVGPWPGIGFFQIRSRQLLTTDPHLGGAQAIDPALSVEQTAARLKKIAARAEHDIERGHMAAPGVGKRLQELESRNDNGELFIAAPCRYCRFGVLCGRALPGGTSGSFRGGV